MDVINSPCLLTTLPSPHHHLTITVTSPQAGVYNPTPAASTLTHASRLDEAQRRRRRYVSLVHYISSVKMNAALVSDATAQQAHADSQ